MSIKREREERAFQLISEAGGEGLLQVEMWKRMGVGNREGSRIARKFEEMGMVQRQRVSLGGGRWTYRLTSPKKTVTLESVTDCPCIKCDEIDKCFSRGHKSPQLCDILTQWIHEGSEKRVSESL